MEEIGKYIKLGDKSESIYQETLREVLQHPKIKALIENSEETITKSMIENDLTLLHQYIESTSCDSCSSLDKCCNTPAGYIPKIDVRHGRIHLIYQPCDKKLKHDEYMRRTSLIKAQFIPQEVTDATFRTIQLYDNTNRREVLASLLKKAKDIIDGKHQKGLYIHGSFGVGKSYFLGALANELSKDSISSVLVYVPEFISNLKGGFSDGTTRQMLDTVKQAEVLILDDLGAEDVTPWVRDDVITSILHYRMVEHLPTFISSNFSMDEVEYHYRKTKDNGIEETKSRRILERIKALCDEVQLRGDNYRNQQLDK